MVLNPKFYEPLGGGRERVRRELGVPGDVPLILLLFGGKGAPEMCPLARRLLELDGRWHVAAVCGDNPRLFARMAPLAEGANGRLHRFGFTPRVHELMDAADLLLTKPGPGSLAEAFHRRVPVVVTLDARTIPQERFNARFVEEQGLGMVARSWQAMADTALELVRDADRLEGLRRKLGRLPQNEAVWDLLAALGTIVSGDRASPSTLHTTAVTPPSNGAPRLV
jgi:1,2-diacylglycerol 3-beta-galactosyltransferase